MTDNERIFELLQTVDGKLTGLQTTMADAMARISSLEAWRNSTQENVNRFWATTWPAEQKLISVLEERLRQVEREQLRADRVEALEANAKEDSKELASRVRELEVAKAKHGTGMAVLAVIGSAAVSALVSFFVKGG
ncbi:hypothetical protein [Myxococcus phage Mx1]|nr:hypothetical protein [Myxococcus phage Mx1]